MATLQDALKNLEQVRGKILESTKRTKDSYLMVNGKRCETAKDAEAALGVTLGDEEQTDE